jgi:hypothetical protein
MPLHRTHRDLHANTVTTPPDISIRIDWERTFVMYVVSAPAQLRTVPGEYTIVYVAEPTRSASIPAARGDYETDLDQGSGNVTGAIHVD